MRPLLLDLFCGAGGAAMGYHRAGFDVVGVDIKPQPRYPFDFYLMDALDVLRPPLILDPPVVIHASPPCQTFSRAGKLREAQGGKPSTENLLEPTRRLLQAAGKPYIIENVPGAPLLSPAVVCGSSFGLGVRRHRLFESNMLLQSSTCRHKEQGRPIGVYHVMGDDIPQGGRTARTLEEGQEAMGIDWMEWAELKEAIPPAYTEFLGQQIISHLERVA